MNLEDTRDLADCPEEPALGDLEYTIALWLLVWNAAQPGISEFWPHLVTVGDILRASSLDREGQLLALEVDAANV